MEREDDLYIYRNRLHPLSQLKDFEVAEGQPDVRGWSVMGKDGVKFGEVHDLIVDLNANKVRYLDVDINQKILKGADDELLHILIPIGVAILNRDDKNVVVPPIDSANLRQHPFYRREPVYVFRDYERSVRGFYGGQTAQSHDLDPEFYEDPWYHSDAF